MLVTSWQEYLWTIAPDCLQQQPRVVPGDRQELTRHQTPVAAAAGRSDGAIHAAP